MAKPVGIKIYTDYPLRSVMYVDDQVLLAKKEHLQNWDFSSN
jgi:hypothetical protein